MNIEDEAAHIVDLAERMDRGRALMLDAAMCAHAVATYRGALLTAGVPRDEVTPLVGMFAEMLVGKQFGLCCHEQAE